MLKQEHEINRKKTQTKIRKKNGILKINMKNEKRHGKIQFCYIFQTTTSFSTQIDKYQENAKTPKCDQNSKNPEMMRYRIKHQTRSWQRAQPSFHLSTLFHDNWAILIINALTISNQ